MTQAGPQRIRDGLSRGGRRVAVVHGTGSGSTLVTRQRAPRARWHYLPLNAMAWRVCRCRHVAVLQSPVAPMRAAELTDYNPREDDKVNHARHH